MRSVFAILLIAAAVSTASAETLDGARFLVIDGDTVALLLPGNGRERIRLVEIDAPEIMHPRCPAERAKGEAAAARLDELLHIGPVTIDRKRKLDRYGRTLARLSTPAGDVGMILQREGLALRWHPGRDSRAARAAQWCP